MRLKQPWWWNLSGRERPTALFRRWLRRGHIGMSGSTYQHVRQSWPDSTFILLGARSNWVTRTATCLAMPNHSGTYHLGIDNTSFYPLKLFGGYASQCYHPRGYNIEKWFIQPICLKQFTVYWVHKLLLKFSKCNLNNCYKCWTIETSKQVCL